MPTPLIPQEVYLLERYSSLEYFQPVRDQWDAMVRHVERCLEVFMERLPPDYRQRRRPYQPDIVWGERVLPNLRGVQQNLFRSYIRLSHGDLDALGAAGGVTGSFHAVKEFSSEWMSEPQVTAVVPDAEDTYWKLLGAPFKRAANIDHTWSRTWDIGDLSHRYASQALGPLCPPELWPRYRLNPAIRVEEGAPVIRTGIYLPDIADSCAALLIEGADWSDGRGVIRWKEPTPEDGIGSTNHPSPITEWRPTGWTLIERVPGETIPFEEGLGPIGSRPPRVPAGEQCPRAGWWYTPAKPGPRRFFGKGDLFPGIEDSDYGDTFWIWSPDQSDPKL